MPWRDTLIELLEDGVHTTQGGLVSALGRRGFEVSQGTVSRELTRLGASKRAGAYRLPPAIDLGAPVHAVHVTAGGCLVVIKTNPAFAALLGANLDASDPPGVLGTISGDDTVFVALDGPASAAHLRRLLGVAGPR
jgi:transcriptional regulator of arginine metabolism